jgi:hypothetical protein
VARGAAWRARLEVSVHDAVRVRVRHRLQHLLNRHARLLLRRLALRLRQHEVYQRRLRAPTHT